MKIPRHPTLIRRQLAAQVKAFKLRTPLLAATLTAIHRQCGRPGCHCQSGKGHPAFHLTYKHKGKTRAVYVPQELLAQVQLWIREHKRIKPILQHISQLALAQVRTHATHRRRQAGRS